ncbi:MAG: aminotransferase class I/II-fold pyridoxal phosphate-dependent enzyme [Lentisphaerota bacterium]
MYDLNYGEKYKEEIELKHEIERRIALSLNVNKKQVMLNYGSNSNLNLIFSAFSLKFLSEKGSRFKLLLDCPNYFYTIKQLSEWFIEPIFVEREADFSLSIDKFISAIKKSAPDMVLITTPNNPSGKPFTDEDIDRIMNTISDDSIILIDRSCLNVLPEISTKSILEIYRSKKIIILHSFSKSYSLSDERLGYLVTNDADIADFLYHKRDLNHNINAVRKCLAILDNQKIIEEKRQILSSCHKLLKKYFETSEKGKYIESFSNFALIELPESLNSQTLVNSMAEKGILIMGGDKIGLSDRYVRLHMSGVEAINAFIARYDEICNHQSAL